MDVTEFCYMILSILAKIDAVIPVTQPGWVLRASLAEVHGNHTGLCFSPAPGFSLASTHVAGSDCKFHQGEAQSHNGPGDSTKKWPKNKIQSSRNFSYMKDWPRTAEILSWVYLWGETWAAKSVLEVWQVLGFQPGRGKCRHSLWKTGSYHSSRITGQEGVCAFAFNC